MNNLYERSTVEYITVEDLLRNTGSKMSIKTFKSSVNVKSLGNPRHLIGRMEMKEGDRELLGTIVGAANGKVKRGDPKDPQKYYFGVSGSFEAISAMDGNPTVGASSLFAPDVIHDQIVAKLDKMGHGAVVKFAFECYVVAGGTAGFTWEYRFLGEDGEPEEDDVLADVRKLVSSGSHGVPQLEHKRAGKNKAA